MLSTLTKPPKQILGFLAKKALQTVAWTVGLSAASAVLGPVAMAAFHPTQYVMGTAIGSFVKTAIGSSIIGSFEMLKWPFHVIGGLIGQYTPLEHVPLIGNLFNPDLLKSTALNDGGKTFFGGAFQNVSNACLGLFGQPIHSVPDIMAAQATVASGRI